MSTSSEQKPRTPNRSGVWRRHWRTRRGAMKSRPCLVRGQRVLQLGDAEWQPLERIQRLPGHWSWIQPEKRATEAPDAL